LHLNPPLGCRCPCLGLPVVFVMVVGGCVAPFLMFFFLVLKVAVIILGPCDSHPELTVLFLKA
jgi:hypothetical protein